MAKKTEAEMCEQQLETERKKICCCDFIQLSLMFSYSTHFFPQIYAQHIHITTQSEKDIESSFGCARTKSYFLNTTPSEKHTNLCSMDTILQQCEYRLRLPFVFFKLYVCIAQCVHIARREHSTIRYVICVWDMDIGYAWKQILNERLPFTRTTLRLFV